MTTSTPYRSRVAPGHDRFTRLVRAEWVKFRTVRGWVITALGAALAIVVVGVSPGEQGSCGTHGSASVCTQPLGPGGEPVKDSFYFVHETLAGNGSITIRMTSLTGQVPDFSASEATPGQGTGGQPMRSGLVPWAKAGIIIKASTRQGSPYAAMMVTGGHGVRMQYDYTGGLPGPAGPVSAASPRWLRLTRSGDTLTGYDSADGTHWANVGTVVLAGLPATVQGGLFAASPQYFQTSLGTASVSGGLSRATGVFDRLGAQGRWSGGRWAGGAIGAPTGPAAASPGGFEAVNGRITVTGTGDIAPSVSGAAGVGVTIAQALIGVFAGLIALAIGTVTRRGAVAVATSLVLIVPMMTAALSGGGGGALPERREQVAHPVRW